jgi:branched-chain amino acid transport system permease protein
VETLREQPKIPVGGALLLLGLALPLLVDEFGTFLLTKLFILSIYGVAFNFAFGFAEVPSFGHAAFFGLGGYAMAMTLQETPETILIPLAVMVVAVLVYAGLVGLVSTRGRGIYFALLTFAFAQGLYEFVIRTPDLTGASRGIFITTPSLPLGINLGSTDHLYYLSLVSLAVTIGFGYRLLQSPFGKVMAAIRHNQDRAEAIGYPVRRITIVIFALSGLFSALAGALFGFTNKLVTPDMLFFTVSIEALIIVIIGGIHSLWGPIAGAAILVGTDQLFGGLENIGTLLTGLMFVLVVLFLPGGISGATYRIIEWIRDRR